MNQPPLFPPTRIEQLHALRDYQRSIGHWPSWLIEAMNELWLPSSDAAESSDAPVGLRTTGATSAAGETAVPATACLPAAVSQTNEETAEPAGTGSAV